jgi:hypothetical protein
MERVVNGSNSNNLTHVFINSLVINGGFFQENIVNKLVSFGTNGVNMFQGMWNGILVQLHINYAPFIMGMHCMDHWCNFVV